MNAEYRTVKGTRDLLPPETEVWAGVEETARRVFGSYGYAEIRTPILEDTELFRRSVGEQTDIVGKEMYTFEDRKGRSLSLRPEGTAPVVRAFVQHNLESLGLPLRLFYLGPYFRYERPQRGRYRQFHQIGAELIGDPGPASDAELLLMLVRFLAELGFADLTVLLNTVGDAPSRSAFAAALRDFLTPRRSELARDSRRRLETNPLRILDTKVPGERELLAGGPRLEEHLSPESREHFRRLTRILAERGVAHRVEPQLVRGLDYYSHTVFEIVSADLGAQDAIVGGGRYDGLIGELGGRDLPAIGFAIGQDRLIDTLPVESQVALSGAPEVRVVRVGDVPPAEVLARAEELRRAGLERVTAEYDDRSVRSALRRADREGVRYVVLVGEEELQQGELALRDLERGEQVSLPLLEVVTRVKERS